MLSNWHIKPNLATLYALTKRFKSGSDLKAAVDGANRMKLFLGKEAEYKAGLEYDLLSEDEKVIHNLHDDAVTKGHFTYDDPTTNGRTLTRLWHFLRGKCCGDACRHMLSNGHIKQNLAVLYASTKRFKSGSDLKDAVDVVNRMKLFWEKEAEYKAGLQYDLLSADEKSIHNLHNDAVTKGHFTYYDPTTNERILTRLRHFLRGKCCGNACRHCVYDHENVIDENKLRVRKFNGSFWTYPDETPIELDESCYFDGSFLRHQEKRPTPSRTFNFSSH